MSSPAFEAFLARLYTDKDLRLRCLASAADVAREYGLSGEECLALEAIDRDGLILAAESYARKRRSKANFNPGRTRLWSRALRHTLGLLLCFASRVTGRHSGKHMNS